ncbi:hypothetical protein M9Y10_009305 [Tritrichomonas musculus]|uniref:Uncharacterized protein n=1 Tax=Tritrichomonas musculus TaxID=1915356 RepID=A0ABR2GLE3_9EUKA
MTEEGFTYTPNEVKEPTPEEKKANAQKMMDMSLDEIIKNQKEEKRKQNSNSGDHRRKSRQNTRNRTKYVNLNLTDRQIRTYLQFADVDTSGYNIKLRLKLVKSDRY